MEPIRRDLTERAFVSDLAGLVQLANRNDVQFDQSWTVHTTGDDPDLMVEITYLSSQRTR